MRKSIHNVVALDTNLTDRHGRTVEFMREEHVRTLDRLEATKQLVSRLVAEKSDAESKLRSLEMQSAFEIGIFEGLGLSF